MALNRNPARYDTNTPVLDIPPLTLVNRLVEYGMPRKDATALITNPGLKLMAVRFYFDVEDANRGDKDAKERVDLCRHIWNEQAKREREREREGLTHAVN